MAKIARDLSFARDGVPLDVWLRRLVDEDPAVRAAAADAIHSMLHALPSVHSNLRDVEPLKFDYQAHKTRFSAAVRGVLAEPPFDAADWVRRLCKLELAADREHQRRVGERGKARDARDQKYDRIAGRLVEQINASLGDAVASDASRRFARLSAAYICGGKGTTPLLDPAAINASVARHAVFDALGAEAVLAPEAVHGLLDARHVRYRGLRLLRQAGPPAIAFAPRLLADLDAAAVNGERGNGYVYSEDAATLAAIARGDAGLVDELIVRLGTAQAVVRVSAALALKHLGVDVCGRNDRAVAALWPLVDSDETAYAALGALASVGRGRRDVRDFVIDRARPAPRRMVRPPDFPQYEFDAAMGARGTAIDAITFFVDHPEECLPALIDAIDSFVEYDPDQSYGGLVARVANVLRAFGPAAAAAAVPLARRLSDPDADTPKDILAALAAMGPAARDALPLLLDYYREHGSGGADAGSAIGKDAAPIDKDDDPAGWTIQQIARPA